jgi:hypothetical protein
MKRYFFPILTLFVLFSSADAQIGGRAGSFARMGFAARGIGMGNAMTAVNSGAISTYYNPALAPFAEQRTASVSFGILTLDRYLNFVSYTQAVQPNAGISLGIINAGVRKIDGRDADGYHTEDYSTSENQFYLAFANRVHQRVSLGVAIKLYYARLFEDFSSTTVGFDIGGLVQVTDKMTVGLCIQDLNSKFKWDSKPLYDQNGKITEDKFPNLRRLALGYKLLDGALLLDVEYENSSEKSNLFRFGTEYKLVEYFTVRGGMDRYETGDRATGAKPAFGFSVKNSFNGWTPELHYAFVFEPIAPQGLHLITLNIAF